MCIRDSLRGHIHSLVHVSVGMAGDGDGSLPVFYHRMNAGQNNGGPKGGSVQNGPDGAVGGLPHLRELRILLHPLLVGRDGGALHSHAQALGGVGSIYRHLILRLVPVQQAQIIEMCIRDSFTYFFAPEEGGFTTVDETTSFYINEDGNPVVVFPEYSIAAGAAGIVEFEIAKA